MLKAELYQCKLNVLICTLKVPQVREQDTRQIIEQRLETSISEMMANIYQSVVESLPFEQAGADSTIIN